MQREKLKSITLRLTLLSLFCSLSVQAATCPSLDEIKTNCIKNKRYNVCTFSANSQGIFWSDKDKYTGVDVPGKIINFVDVEFKSNTPIKKRKIAGRLNSCVYETKDGLEIVLDPKNTSVAIPLDGNWKKTKSKLYFCNASIPCCQFEFIAK